MLWLSLILPGPAAAQTAECVPPGGAPDHTVALPGHPFGIASSADGCRVFVTMPELASADGAGGVAVLGWHKGRLSVERSFPYGGLGSVLTHNGAVLIIASRDHVVFLDAGRLSDGKGEPLLGVIDTVADQPTPSNPESIYVTLTRDDRLLFVSDENLARITVIDLDRVSRLGFQTDAILGHIPVGLRPIAVTLSKDERYLFTTSQYAEPGLHWPARCAAEGTDSDSLAPALPEGVVEIIDVASAVRDSQRAVIGRAAAGCNPVRLVLSPDGQTAWVSARSSGAVLAFDAGLLVSDPEHARIAQIPVGSSPVGLSLTGDGRRLWVANSDRFTVNVNAPQWLTAIELAAGGRGPFRIAGRLQAGAFPREIHILEDGRTVLVGNFQSRSLQVLDSQRSLPPRP